MRTDSTSATLPPRTVQVLALLASGKTPQAVAAELGIGRNTVYSLVSKARSRQPSRTPVRPVGHTGARPTSQVELNYDVVRALRPFAAQRATTVAQIAREIVEAALDGGQIGSLLEGRF